MEPSSKSLGAANAVANEIKAPSGLALFFMATALSLVTIFVLPEWEMPAQWPIVIVVLWMTSVWILLSALNQSLSRVAEQRLDLDRMNGQRDAYYPAVLTAVLSPSTDAELTLLLEPNRLFGQSMIVSVYHEDSDGMEILVGDGAISNVQGNGRLQVAIRGWEAAYEHLRQKVIQKDGPTLSALIVRPAPTTVTRGLISNPDLLRQYLLAQFGEQNNDRP